MLRSTLSIILRWCLKSLKVKGEASILFKLSRFRKWNTHTVQQTLRITKKKKFWVILQNLHMIVLRWCSEMSIGQTFYLAWHVIESHFKEESSLIFLAKKLIRIGEKFVPKTACLSLEVSKYTAELSFGSSCNILSWRAQMSTEICIKLFTRTR